MCEDYPCCGHTPDDPCGAQWYDAPDAFDVTTNPHALCDHENGDCDVWDEDFDECDEDHQCEDCGRCVDACICDDRNEVPEDDWLDGSYEE